MGEETLENALCKTIAMHSSHSYEDIKRIYKKLHSIDKTIVALETATMNNITPDYVADKLKLVF